MINVTVPNQSQLLGGIQSPLYALDGGAQTSSYQLKIMGYFFQSQTEGDFATYIAKIRADEETVMSEMTWGDPADGGSKFGWDFTLNPVVDTSPASVAAGGNTAFSASGFLNLPPFYDGFTAQSSWSAVRNNQWYPGFSPPPPWPSFASPGLAYNNVQLGPEGSTLEGNTTGPFGTWYVYPQGDLHSPNQVFSHVVLLTWVKFNWTTTITVDTTLAKSLIVPGSPPISEGPASGTYPLDSGTFTPNGSRTGRSFILKIPVPDWEEGWNEGNFVPLPPS